MSSSRATKFNALRLFRLIALVFFATTIINSCKKDDIEEPPPTTKTPVIPAGPTLYTSQPGVPTGPITTAMIGTTGGTITSADGGLAIAIPAGALSSETQISIQEITNTGPKSIGKAYRLGPEGTTFNVPVDLEFSYQDSELQGFPEELMWITTQKTDGSWEASIRIDPTPSTNKIKTSVRHFSDWGLGRFVDLNLLPSSSILKKGNSLTLHLNGFEQVGDDNNDDLVPLLPINNPNTDLTPLVPIAPNDTKLQNFQVTQWTLNGNVAPVSGNQGNLNPSVNKATYTAPQQLPSPNPVTVSVYLNASNYLGGISSFIINASIKIVESDLFFSINLDGHDYLFTQWAVNGLAPPDPDNVMLAMCSLDETNHLIFGGTSLVNGTNEGGNVIIDIAIPTLGSNNLIGYYEEGNDDVDFNLYSGGGLTNYSINYTQRWIEGPSCSSENKSGSFTVTLTTLNQATHEASGSFIGFLYKDPPNAWDDCLTSDEYPVSGEFKLYLP